MVTDADSFAKPRDQKRVRNVAQRTKSAYVRER